MLAQEIAQYIGENVTGIDYDASGLSGNIFVGLLPVDPIECIAVTPSGGFITPTTQSVDQPTIQVLVRRHDPRDAFNVAQEVLDLLNGFHQYRLVEDGTFIINCVAMNGPTHLGLDNNGMTLYSINFILDTINENRRNT